jgi:ribosome biogenesis GTPase A
MTAPNQSPKGLTDQRHSMQSALRILVSIDQQSGLINSSLHGKLLSLEKKLASNQLHLAVLGQMKRGKSSFINALLKAEVLPTGVVPVTAIITEIKYGPAPEASILYNTGLRQTVDISSLADYITEAGNPGNKKELASVDLAYPSPFLEYGIILIDTPGIGSTHAHNTRTTEGYLDQVDAGIVVLSVDPPITEVESRFLRSLKDEIPKLFFVVNKIDVASPDEVTHISAFLENELGRLQIESPEVFCLSARRALENLRPGKAPVPSGIETFEHRLGAFLAEEKTEVLVRSIASDALQLCRTLKFAATIGQRARTMRPEDFAPKQRVLEELLATTDAEMRELQVLVHQHSTDMVAAVERDLNMHVQESVPLLRCRLEEFQSQHPKETGRALGVLLETCLMEQIEIIFRTWRIRKDEEVQRQLDLLAMRFVQRANTILEHLQQSAGVLFDIPLETVSVACPLRVESRLYYRIEPVFHSLDSFLLALPRFLLRPIVLRKMNNRVWPLLDMNAGRIRYDYVERLQTTMALFEKELSVSVTVVTETLKSALQKPRDTTGRESEVLGALNAVTAKCSELLSSTSDF